MFLFWLGLGCLAWSRANGLGVSDSESQPKAVRRRLNLWDPDQSDIAICVPHAIYDNNNLEWVIRTNSSFVQTTPGVTFSCQGNLYTLRPFSLYSWGFQKMCAVEIADWNGDGKPDMIVGLPDGRLTLYNRTTVDWNTTNATSGFDIVESLNLQKATNHTNPFRDIVVTPQMSLKAIDVNHDGTLDLLIGTDDGLLLWYDQTANGRLVRNVIVNISNLAYPGGTPYPPSPVTPHLVDWDGDGDADIILLIENATFTKDNYGPRHQFGLVYLERNGTGALDWRIWNLADPNVSDIFGLRTLMQVTSPKAVSAYDFNGDRRQDLLVQGDSSFSLRLFEQRARGLTEWTGAANMLEGLSQTVSEWLKNQMNCSGSAEILPCDWDNDGATDIWYNCMDDSTGMMMGILLRGEKKRTMTERTGTDSPFLGLPVQPDPAVPDVYDLDGDGLQDLILGSTNSLTFYRRLKNRAGLDAGYPMNPIDTTFLRRPAPHVVDWDGDGVPDIIVGSVQSGLRFFRGNRTSTPGPPRIPDFVELRFSANPLSVVNASLGGWLVVRSTDWNYDGRLDVLVGADSGTLFLFLNDTSSNTMVPRTQLQDSNLSTILKELGSVGCKFSAPDVVQKDSNTTQISVGCSNGKILRWERSWTGAAARMEQLQTIDSTGGTIAPRGVDWDLDGDLDLVLGSTGGQVDYYAAGFCMPQEPCSNRGSCGPQTGACSCYDSYAGSDCSKCDDEQAFSDPNLTFPTWRASCLPCPKTSSNGVCNGAGQCITDAWAAADVRSRGGSSTEAFMAAGNGSCICYGKGRGLNGTACDASCEKGTYLDLGAHSELVTSADILSVPTFGMSKELSSVCFDCEAGKYNDKEASTMCSLCPIGYYSAPGSATCTKCPKFMTTAFPGASTCIVNWRAPVWLLAIGCSLCMLMLVLAEIVLHKAGINDVTLCSGEVTVRTQGHHGISRSVKWTLRVNFYKTGNRSLDNSEEPFYCQVLGAGRLKLVDKDGLPLPGETQTHQRLFDTSHGYLQFRPGVRVLFLIILRIPAIVWIAGLSGAFAGLILTYNEIGASEIGYAAIAAALNASLLKSLDLLAFRYGLFHDLSWKIWEFRRELLVDRKVEEVEKGPSRALALSQLEHFFHTFEKFIQDRNMYYICSNLVFPLTANEQCSMAELMGPKEADWFISHYWGMKFQDFLATIRAHAWKTAKQDAASFWICTFSNNQWKIKDELGTSWEESPFFVTLASERCQGTLMVMDEQALPLTRVWCLFEVLVTLELERDAGKHAREAARGQAQSPRSEASSSLQPAATGEATSEMGSILSKKKEVSRSFNSERLLKGRSLHAVEGFRGLLLGTRAGVLTDGHVDVATTLKVADRLALLDLASAQASNEEDRKMINDLVGQVGFPVVNFLVQQKISAALMNAKSTVEDAFKTIEDLLAKAKEDAGVKSRRSHESRLAAHAEEETRPALFQRRPTVPDTVLRVGSFTSL